MIMWYVQKELAAPTPDCTCIDTRTWLEPARQVRWTAVFSFAFHDTMPLLYLGSCCYYYTSQRVIVLLQTLLCHLLVISSVCVHISVCCC